jgi:hypothetical protein
MAEGYVGRFGDTLRKLSALDAQRGALAPQQVGGADTAGAFGVAPAGPMQGGQIQGPLPPEAPQPGAFAMAEEAAPAPAQGGFGSQPAATMPAFDQPSPVIDESGAMGGSEQPPTTWQDLSKQMPKSEQNAMADAIEAKVGDLPATYQRAAAQAGITPKKRASRAHMAMFITEIALRTAANRGTSDSDGEALAKGVLQTQERRGAMQIAEQERQRAEAEKRRLEQREDAKDEKVYTRGRTDKESDYKRDRADKTADDERNHKQALELAREQARLLKEKGQRTSIQVGDDGQLKLVDLETGGAITVTEEVEETTTRGSRGSGTTTTTKKVKKPVKASPKYNAGGLDQDTLVNRVSDAEKALRGDKKLMRELRSKYGNDSVKVEEALRNMAREKVEGDVQSLGAGSSGTIDFNELK